jgi:signal transduction histidine kinase
VLQCQQAGKCVITRQSELPSPLRPASEPASAPGQHGSLVARHRGVRLQDDACGGPGGYGRYVRTISDVPAARQRPPLTKRLSPRYWAALDWLAAALFGVILVTTVTKGVGQGVALPAGVLRSEPFDLYTPVALLFVVVAVIAVALRRRRPVLMLDVLLVASVMTALTGPGKAALVYFLPIAYVLYLVAATYERRRAAVRVLIAVFATLFLDAVMLEVTGAGGVLRGALVPVTLCVIVVWSTGYSVRQQRRYAVRLQDEAASKAVAQERLRIARELHDVVAHSMSVIAVQAGYGQYVIDAQPADARSALGAIQATSREALDEMRRMLGALRQADETEQRGEAAQAADGVQATLNTSGQRIAEGAPLFPAPGLADLDRLLSRTASAGVRVDVTRCGPPRELPASIDLSAYRIVQEALTNVVKHARTSSCQVLIGYGHDELILEVTDNGAGLPELAGAGISHRGAVNGHRAVSPAGSAATVIEAGYGGHGWDVTDDLPGGHGIIGMRERVTLLGGEFSAGPRPGYGFQVSAHIPLPQDRSL